MPRLDLTKPYRASNGCEAKVVQAPNGKLHGYLVVDGEPQGYVWDGNGVLSGCYANHGFSLVNVPETRTVKVNMEVREDDVGGSLATTWCDHDAGKAWRGGRLVASIRREITYTVGEGLDG